MIIEEVKEKNKELWIMLQDMKKAFDSVSLNLLKLALQRIRQVIVVFADNTT